MSKVNISSPITKQKMFTTKLNSTWLPRGGWRELDLGAHYKVTMEKEAMVVNVKVNKVGTTVELKLEEWVASGNNLLNETAMKE